VSSFYVNSGGEPLAKSRLCVDICVEVETLVVEVVKSRPKHGDVAKE
jgi:hypothetical protein